MTPRPVQIGIDPPAIAWTVGRASQGDVAGIVVAVQELLLELGGAPPPAGALAATVHMLVDDDSAGAALVARLDQEVIGVLAASWQIAIHVPGEYATIQDLWVHPTWRNHSIGADLITGLVDLARERGIARVEVGLPRDSFASIDATRQFYRAHGFAELGPRMRLVLS